MFFSLNIKMDLRSAYKELFIEATLAYYIPSFGKIYVLVIYVVLGTRTWGVRMEGADVSTEIRRPP